MIQITIEDLEESISHAANFMSDNRVDFRKKFMLDMFDRIDEEALTY